SVGVGELTLQLGSVALDEAPRHEDFLAVAACVDLLEDRVDGLLPRALDERARIDDDDIGPGGLVDGLVAFAPKRAEETFGVLLVLRTAERTDENLRGHALKLQALVSRGVRLGLGHAARRRGDGRPEG